jgi:hypothetical protein
LVLLFAEMGENRFVIENIRQTKKGLKERSFFSKRERDAVLTEELAAGLIFGLGVGCWAFFGGRLARDTGMGRPEVLIIAGLLRPVEGTIGIFAVFL